MEKAEKDRASQRERKRWNEQTNEKMLLNKRRNSFNFLSSVLCVCVLCPSLLVLCISRNGAYALVFFPFFFFPKYQNGFYLQRISPVRYVVVHVSHNSMLIAFTQTQEKSRTGYVAPSFFFATLPYSLNMRLVLFYSIFCLFSLRFFVAFLLHVFVFFSSLSYFGVFL